MEESSFLTPAAESISGYLIFCDWLEEHGDQRAEILRRQLFEGESGFSDGYGDGDGYGYGDGDGYGYGYGYDYGDGYGYGYGEGYGDR